MQGDGFASEPGGIMEVAVWLCVSLLLGLSCSFGLVPNYVVLVLNNEGGGSSSFARLPYTGPIEWFKETSSFDFEYSSHIQLRIQNIFSFLMPMFSPKANMNICILYQPHSHWYVQ